MTLANEIVPVNAFEFELVIFLSFDKIIGFFFFLAVVLVFAYTLGKRAGRREVHGLMALTEPVETAEGEVQAPPTPRTRAMTDCRRFTAGEISFLVGEGYDVWPDDVVEPGHRGLPDPVRNRQGAEWRRASSPGADLSWRLEWHQPSAPNRVDPSPGGHFAPGVPYKAMCGALQTEAQALRAQLATVRVVEGELQPLRVVMSSVPDLPVGTIVSSTS